MSSRPPAGALASPPKISLLAGAAAASPPANMSSAGSANVVANAGSAAGASNGSSAPPNGSAACPGSVGCQGVRTWGGHRGDPDMAAWEESCRGHSTPGTQAHDEREQGGSDKGAGKHRHSRGGRLGGAAHRVPVIVLRMSRMQTSIRVPRGSEARQPRGTTCSHRFAAQQGTRQAHSEHKFRAAQRDVAVALALFATSPWSEINRSLLSTNISFCARERKLNRRRKLHELNKKKEMSDLFWRHFRVVESPKLESSHVGLRWRL